MTRILTSVVLLVLLFPSLALGETVKFEDLVEREGLHYKKSSQVFAKGHQLTFTGTVTGPSFECSKATKAIEHAICASRKLSALDRELSKAYKVAKAQLKSGSTDETILLVEQRLWNKERSSRCPKATSRVMEGCLATMYGERINQLTPLSSENIQLAVEDECLASPNYACVVSLAFSTAKAIEDRYDFASALAEISLAQATVGKMKDATETVSRSLSYVNEQIKKDREIPSVWDSGMYERATALAKIAKAQTIMGNLKEASKTFSLALSYAGKGLRASDRVSAFSRIAEKQAEGGEIKEAMETIGRAEDNAEYVRSSGRPAWFYLEALTDIALAQISAGRLEEANRNITHAQTIAKEIEDDPLWKEGSSFFYGIALALAKLGNYQEAFRTAKMSRGHYYRTYARKLVLEKMILARASVENIKEALATAISIKDIYRGSKSGYMECVQALAGIAKLLEKR